MTSSNMAESDILQFIYTDPKNFTNYVQKLQDFAISHMAECDQEMIYDVIPAVNQFLIILRNHNNAGTLLISE
jgi:hypothetical protein